MKKRRRKSDQPWVSRDGDLLLKHIKHRVHIFAENQLVGVIFVRDDGGGVWNYHLLGDPKPYLTKQVALDVLRERLATKGAIALSIQFSTGEIQRMEQDVREQAAEVAVVVEVKTRDPIDVAKVQQGMDLTLVGGHKSKIGQTVKVVSVDPLGKHVFVLDALGSINRVRLTSVAFPSCKDSCECEKA